MQKYGCDIWKLRGELPRRFKWRWKENEIANKIAVINLAGKIFGNLDFTMSLEYIYFIECSNYYGLTLTWDVFKLFNKEIGVFSSHD